MELVKIINGKPYTSSLLIARYLKKRHRVVLKSIAMLNCSDDFDRQNFSKIFFADNYGIQRYEFAITRDGFAFLVMALKSKKAAKCQEDFTLAFNCIDASLARNPHLTKTEANSNLKRISTSIKRTTFWKCLNLIEFLMSILDNLKSLNVFHRIF